MQAEPGMITLIFLLLIPPCSTCVRGHHRRWGVPNAQSHVVLKSPAADISTASGSLRSSGATSLSCNRFHS